MADMWKELPVDVISEILPKLPASSLLRFKCVCKTWYDIIISPRFIDAHYATNKHKQASFYYHSCDYSCFKPESDTNFSFRLFHTPVDLTIRGYTKSLSIVGCSKGVVCLSLYSFLSKEYDFAVWNPATKQYRRIGPVEDDQALGWGRSGAGGFCFDPVKNTFKVTATLVSFQEKEVITARMSTFTLNTNSWSVKAFDTTHLNFPGCDYISYSTCSNRCMYWIITGYSKENSSDIHKYVLYFDMVDEVFERINFPFANARAWLEGYRDTVALIAFSGYNFDLWVLMDDDSGGASKSWSKQITCRLQKNNGIYVSGFFVNADEVYLTVLKGSEYCLYNIKTGAVTKLSERNYNAFFQYSESLASIC